VVTLKGHPPKIIATEAMEKKAGDDQLLRPFCRGLMEDLKAKADWYWTDIQDGLNWKALSSIVFMFLSVFPRAIVFGGSFQYATDGAMGMFETLLATGVFGLFYALVAGQPLGIMATTAPVFTFIVLLYQLAGQYGLPFLPFYGWVGLWMSAFMLLSSVFSFSNFMKYTTRFTDEIFILLICALIVKDGLDYFYGLFLNPFVPIGTASLTLNIGILTFFSASFFSSFRSSRYLPEGLRRNLSDFAYSFAILSGFVGAIFLKGTFGVQLQTPTVPELFRTTSGRPWLIPLMDLPARWRLITAAPGLLGFLLFFMEQNISTRLVNRKKHKLKKPYGYDLDLLVVAVITAISSVFGLPWLVAAAMPSLKHLASLVLYKGEPVASSIASRREWTEKKLKGEPGDTGDGEASVSGDVMLQPPEKKKKSANVGVVENRVTGAMIHILLLLALFFERKLIGEIPEAVEKAVFVSVGLAKLRGNEFLHRIFSPLLGSDKLPNEPWAVLPRRKIHVFTLIQIICLAALWILKASDWGILFPVLIAALHPIRVLIERQQLFTQSDLEILDSDE